MWPLLVATLAGCDHDVPGPEEVPKPLPTATASPSLSAAAAATPRSVLTGDPALLRRGYGAVDMRFGDCVTRNVDGSLIGQACDPGTVVFGPYVEVPAESEVEISFEIKSEVAGEVYADLVSRMGQRLLAAIDPQPIAAGEERKLGYRVRLSVNESAVESRVGLRAPGKVGFLVKNYTVIVR